MRAVRGAGGGVAGLGVEYDRVVQQTEQCKQLFDTSVLEVGGPKSIQQRDSACCLL